MKFLLSIICALFITNGFTITVEKPIPVILFIEAGNDLDDLEDAIDSALSYLKKALNSSSLSDVQYYARKAKNYASEAEDIADDLELDDIEYYCYKAYKCARAAEGESSMENAMDYLTTARKSMQNAYYEL